jgi:hypothetical protein
MVTFMKVDTKCQGKLIIVIVFDLDVFFGDVRISLGRFFQNILHLAHCRDSADEARDKNIWQVFDRSLCSVRASSRMCYRTLTFDGDPNREGVHVYVV